MGRPWTTGGVGVWYGAWINAISSPPLGDSPKVAPQKVLVRLNSICSQPCQLENVPLRGPSLFPCWPLPLLFPWILSWNKLNISPCLRLCFLEETQAKKTLLFVQLCPLKFHMKS